MAEDQLKSQGEILEGIAFQFCKIATFAVLAGRYVIPVAAALCSIFFLAAYLKGQRTSRCILRYPLLISACYLAVTVISVWFLFRPR